MENIIRNHQQSQDLRGQIIEVTEICLNFQLGVDNMKKMIISLIEHHNDGSTNSFRSDEMIKYTSGNINESQSKFIN